MKFLVINEGELRALAFDGTQIRRLLNDSASINTMQSVELDAWNAFKTVLANLLRNTNAKHYKILVGNLLQAF